MTINNCLIIEDDNAKCNEIVNFFQENYKKAKIIKKSALNSGLFEMSKNEYDLIILDMSLPIFEGKKNINFEPYGGIEFLKEMEEIENETNVIVITQFSIFGEGKNEKTFEELKEYCINSFKNCKGVIYFLSHAWQEELKKLLEK